MHSANAQSSLSGSQQPPRLNILSPPAIILLTMTTVRSYFANIYENIHSIAVGMKITLKYCFQKTVTVQYPEQHLTFAPRYRGIHEFEMDKCIACDMCAKACPVDWIYIDKTAPRKIDKKKGIVDM